ncbi:hypothetical protein NW768_003771 [Fusarium equiseti]|uniref:Uncharacterized protein n=1 Tax=Fusarium equiseti TaxID=61235 RepID=A0ABQ8RIJ7_FUSEQ|nr:hypothetical protein NW768_003771 [Fusarium equiseti]
MNVFYHQGRDNVPFTMAAWKRFWNKVLEDWNTTYGELEPIPLAPRRFQATNIRVGHPKRDYPPKNAERQPPSRRQGAPVFLSITTKAFGEEIEFIWKNSKDKFVGASHVELTAGDHSKAMFMAVERYDSSIRLAYAKHNEQRFLYYARRQILHFAERGAARGIHQAKLESLSTLSQSLLGPEPTVL